MRRGAAFGIALALCLGTAACGDDGGGDAAGGDTRPSTTSEALDLTAEVEDFCATTDELKSLIQESAPAPGEAGPAPPSTETSPEMSELAGEAGQMMMRLQGLTGQMLPSDAARFRECAAFFGGGVGMSPG